MITNQHMSSKLIKPEFCDNPDEECENCDEFNFKDQICNLRSNDTMTSQPRTFSKPVNQDDIFLLLESYKNNIQLTTTLLEQQKQLLTQQSEVINKQNDLCDNMEKVLKKFDDCFTNSNNIQTKVLESQTEIKTNVNTAKTEVSTVVGKVKEELKTEVTIFKTDVLKDHNRLAILLYGLGGGMGVIVLALITFMVAWSDKLHTLTDLVSKMPK
jgi:hypothetical protein